MKNRIISGILLIILGFFIAVGPMTIFPVCSVHTEGQSNMGSSDTGDGQAKKHNESSEFDSMKETTSNKGFKENSMVMKCHWTARTELGIGILIAIFGILLIVIPSALIRLGLSISLALNGLLALLIPNVFIGVCGGAHMSCRLLALPALSIFSSAVIITATVNGVFLKKSVKADKRRQGEP